MAIATETVAERAKRRIARRLLPFLLLLFVLAYLDRTNIAVASIGMRPEFGFTEAFIGSAAGIFFLGYFLLEIPGTLIVERWSARKWIARIMVTWGIIASLMGFIGKPIFGALHLETQFNALRFTLGLAEAGFFPGVIVYLAHWFRYEDRARTKSAFLIGIPLATIVATAVVASHHAQRGLCRLRGLALGIHPGRNSFRYLRGCHLVLSNGPAGAGQVAAG